MCRICAYHDSYAIVTRGNCVAWSPMNELQFALYVSAPSNFLHTFIQSCFRMHFLEQSTSLEMSAKIWHCFANYHILYGAHKSIWVSCPLCFWCSLEKLLSQKSNICIFCYCGNCVIYHITRGEVKWKNKLCFKTVKLRVSFSCLLILWWLHQQMTCELLNVVDDCIRKH